MKDGYLNINEYIRQGEPTQRERAEAWSVAIGLQGVNGWCAPKGQQTDSKGQRPVAIGEDGEIGKMMNGMVGLTKHNMLLPLRGGFCESSQIPWTLPMAGRLSPFQGVNGWCAPKGQQTDSKGQRPVAIGEDGEIGKMMNGMVGLTKHNMLLPLWGEFCESSQMPWATPMAGRLSPFQAVNGCAPRRGNHPTTQWQRLGYKMA